MTLSTPLPIDSQTLVTIDIGDAVSKAQKLMATKTIRHLVVTQHGKGIGVISDRDVMRAMRTEIQDLHEYRVRDQHIDESILVGDVMGWPVRSVDVEAPLSQLIDQMLDQKISSLLVTRNNESIVSIVTTDDLLLLLRRFARDHESHGKLGLPQPMQWMATLYNSPIGTVLDSLSNSGI